jgi:hypothetical protein
MIDVERSMARGRRGRKRAAPAREGGAPRHHPHDLRPLPRSRDRWTGPGTREDRLMPLGSAGVTGCGLLDSLH